jgi:hypothetical protein
MADSFVRPLLAANWKMNPVIRADAVELAREVADAARTSSRSSSSRPSRGWRPSPRP